MSTLMMIAETVLLCKCCLQAHNLQQFVKCSHSFVACLIVSLLSCLPVVVGVVGACLFVCLSVYLFVVSL